MNTLYTVVNDQSVAYAIASAIGTIGDANGDQVLSFNEFSAVAQAIATHFSFNITATEIQEAFALADADGNNSVDIHEAAQFVRYVAKSLAHEIASALFRTYSGMGIGFDIVSGLLSNVAQIRAKVQAAFNGTTHISQSQFVAFFRANAREFGFNDQIGNAVFSAADTNNDNQLSVDEATNFAVRVLGGIRFAIGSFMDAYRRVFSPGAPSILEASASASSSGVQYFRPSGSSSSGSSSTPADPIAQYTALVGAAKYQATDLLNVYVSDARATAIGAGVATNFDVDSNGRLSKAEFEAVAAYYSHVNRFPISQHMVDAAFALGDADNSNSIDYTEGYRLLQFMSKEIATAIVQVHYKLANRFHAAAQMIR